MKKFLLVVASILLTTLPALAQIFEMSGQVRPRAEFKHGYKSLIGEGIDPAFGISQRTRLNLSYSAKSLKTYLSLQNVRMWGDVATANRSDANGTMIHQAWGEYFLNPKFSLKAGRQTISLDDQRLFGVSDWNQQARSHDAFLLKYSPSKTYALQAGISYNQSSEKDTGTFYTLTNYKAMQYLHAHFESSFMGLSLLAANVGIPGTQLKDTLQEQKIYYSQTFGPLLTYSHNKLKATLALYYQCGLTNKNRKKSAFFASSDLNYKVSNRWNTGLGFQYLSGNDQVNPDAKDHEFSTLFGSGHKFNGWMDYFYAGNSHKGVGLLDIYLPMIYKKDKASVEFQLHYYRSAASVAYTDNSNRNMDSFLGMEPGIMFSYDVSNEMSISGGYSQMFGTETLEALKGGNHNYLQNWTWVMLTFNPVFYKSEK